jgi:hypothetical protein
MAYSLREAAEAVGKGKPAILTAIQSGKISAQKHEHGERQIDPAELHRIYPPAFPGAGSEPDRKESGATAGNGIGNSLLEREIRFLHEKLADLQRLRHAERRDLSERFEDLRRDRDNLRRERDRLRQCPPSDRSATSAGTKASTRVLAKAPAEERAVNL